MCPLEILKKGEEVDLHMGQKTGPDPPPPPSKGGRRKQHHTILTIGFTSHKPGRVRVQLMIQKILDVNGKCCIVLWDRHSNLSDHPSAC
jgi:hypothetical protein